LVLAIQSVPYLAAVGVAALGRDKENAAPASTSTSTTTAAA